MDIGRHLNPCPQNPTRATDHHNYVKFSISSTGHHEDLALSSHIVSQNPGLDKPGVSGTEPSPDTTATTPVSTATTATASEPRRPVIPGGSQQSPEEHGGLLHQPRRWIFRLPGSDKLKKSSNEKVLIERSSCKKVLTLEVSVNQVPV